MGAEVVITSQASSDLSEIIEYLAKKNPFAAEKLSDDLLDTALALGNAPRVGCRIKGYPNVRMTVHRKYLIFYEVEAGAKRLLILRFWHSARDLRKLQLNL